uniref:Uncharacterized protein n=1 Tax=Anguilla anguilla TaxID=7936 RepID=A0A0E9XD40_ANGAN
MYQIRLQYFCGITVMLAVHGLLSEQLYRNKVCLSVIVHHVLYNVMKNCRTKHFWVD